MATQTEQQILRERARALAIPRTTSRQDDEQAIRVLEFILTGERYGIGISYISETINIQDLTYIPGTPDFIAGVINVRGRIVPVADLKRFFHLEQIGISASPKTIILKAPGYEVAFLADSIEGIRVIPESHIQPVPLRTQGINRDLLIGVSRDLLILIDGQALIRKLESTIKQSQT